MRCSAAIKGKKVSRLLAIDGKPRQENWNKDQKANRIVNAVNDSGRNLWKKTNEIKSLPELLGCLNTKGTIITTETLKTQTALVKKIRQKRADYILVLKANQGSLLENVKKYFSGSKFLWKYSHKKEVKKARRTVDKRKYWQIEDITWLSQKKECNGFRSILLTANIITVADRKVTLEEKYFINSLPLDIEEVKRVFRSHWMIENYHWHLNVTFCGDRNHTLVKQVTCNLNTVRTLALNVLKLSKMESRLSNTKKRRYTIWANPEKRLEKLMNLYFLSVIQGFS